MSFKKIDCNLTQKFSEYPDFGVLNGVKVFVSGTAIAGPFAGCLMAEMGAKVLQSEAPKISCGTRGTTSPRPPRVEPEPPQRVLHHHQLRQPRRQEDLQKVPRVGRYLDRVQQGRHLCQDGPHR